MPHPICKLRIPLLVVLLGGLCPTQGQAQVSLWKPRQVNAVFVEPGKTFNVQVRAAPQLESNGWKVTLKNDLRAWAAVVVAAERGPINNGFEDGWRLTVRVPGDIAPELFDLALANPKGESDTAVRAVSVVRDLESDFYILHLTDEHVRELAASESKEPKNGFRTAELVRWAVPAVNLINPRFVVNSGDCTYQYHSSGKLANSANLYQRYADAKAGYRVASLTVPGNHDIPKEGEETHAAAVAQWEAALGQRSFSVRLGSFYVLAHDFSDQKLQHWAAADYKASAADPSVQGRLVFEHFAGYGEKKTGDWFAFKPQDSPWPDLMLIGHIHVTSTEQLTPFPVLMSIAAHRYARAGFLEFKKTNEGRWICPSVETWGPTAILSLVGDGGVPKVSAKFTAPNDGTRPENTVTIKNELPRRFGDGRVRFLLPPGAYRLAGGDQLAAYGYTNASGSALTAVLVKVDLPANEEKKVTITPQVP